MEVLNLCIIYSFCMHALVSILFHLYLRSRAQRGYRTAAVQGYSRGSSQLSRDALLHLAAGKDHAQALKVLLEHGADVSN